MNRSSARNEDYDEFSPLDRQLQKENTKMPLLEKLRLDPIGKYEKHNRFPWKLVVHVVLAVLTTYEAIAMVNLRSGYQRELFQVFRDSLLRAEVLSFTNTIKIYSLEQFQHHINNLQNLFNNLDGELIPLIDTSDLSYSFKVYYQEFETTQFGNLIFNVPDITNFTQPFDPNNLTSIRTLLQEALQINFMAGGFITHVPYSAHKDYYTCFIWNVSMLYVVGEGAIKGTLLVQNDYCSDQQIRDFGPNLIFVHLLVFIFSSISLYLACKYVYQVTVKYNQHKRQKKTYERELQQLRRKISVLASNPQLRMKHRAAEETNQDAPQDEESISSSDSEQQTLDLLNYRLKWGSMTLIQKLSFFNLYIIFSIIGNLIQMIGALVSLFNLYIDIRYPVFQYKIPIIGFGCMCAWLVLLNYLKYYDRYNVMNRTMWAASSSLIFFTLGCLPFFFAFVYLCQMIFVRVDQFNGLLTTSISLFSLCLGDSMNDFFNYTLAQGFLGHIVLILYAIIFFTAVQNIFIALVMDAYDVVRKRRKHRLALQQQWIYQEQVQLASVVAERSQPYQMKHPLTSTNLQQFSENIQDGSIVALPKNLENISISQLQQNQRISTNYMVMDKIYQYQSALKTDLESLSLLLQDIDAANLTQQQRRLIRRAVQVNLSSLNQTLKYEINN